MKAYLQTLGNINEHGNARGDRTGTGTMSLFGQQMRFNLLEGFPLVTSKKVFTKGIIEELLWIIGGHSNNNLLKDRGVNIWTEWAVVDQVAYSVEERYELLGDKLSEEEFSKVRLEANALEGDEEARHAVLDRYEIPRFGRGPHDGELGPIYGVQWRKWKKVTAAAFFHTRTAEELLAAAAVAKRFDLVHQITSDLEVSGEISSLTMANIVASPVAVTEQRTHYETRTIDQLAEVIESLKKNPYSRRHIVSAWNPADLGVEGSGTEIAQQNALNGKMALSPCHALFQFYMRDRPIQDIKADAGEALWNEFEAWQNTLVAGVDYKGSKLNVDYSKICFKWLNEHGVRTYLLDCQLYQRSADMFLGVPFNIASYSLLTMMVAQVIGTAVAGEFVWTGGDCHIYSNHFDQVDTQLGRAPRALPKMNINPAVKNIDDFTVEDFQLVGYDPHPAIKGEVSI